MEKILEIATNVSTPIAVAGLIVGVLLIIFYAILRLKIFPRLNRALGAEILASMMRYLYRLAMVAVVLGFVAYLTPVVLAAIFPVYKVPADTAKVPLNFETTLGNAIKYVAKLDGHPSVEFKGCDEATLNTQVNKATYTGKKYSDIIIQLQFNLANSNPKEIYTINLSENGIYEIFCRN